MDTKPVDRDAANARIDLAHCSPFAIGTAAVRPATRDVVCGDRTIVVEPRVMQVLVALVRADGAILSRDDLTRSCWDDRIVGEDAINRVISRLRRLALDCGESFRVETITKVGYRLILADAKVAEARAAPSLRRRALAGVGGVALLLAVGVWAVSWLPHGANAPDAAASGVAVPDTADDPLPAEPRTAAL